MENITDRELRAMQIVDRMRIVRANDIAWMAGYTDYTYCRKSLNRLVKLGYLRIERDFKGANCYCLTGKGLATIGKQGSHPYEISATTVHALTVARVAAWLCVTQNAEPLLMETDSTLRAKHPEMRHRPDIVLDDVAYEIELSHKPQAVLEKNILTNNAFNRQIWVVPDNRRNVATNIQVGARHLGIVAEIIRLSKLERAMIAADIHSNRRDNNSGIESVLSIPARTFDDKHDSYFDIF